MTPNQPAPAGQLHAEDFATTDQPISPQHYAFLVSEEDFDGIFARIQAQGIPYGAARDGPAQ